MWRSEFTSSTYGEVRMHQETSDQSTKKSMLVSVIAFHFWAQQQASPGGGQGRAAAAAACRARCQLHCNLLAQMSVHTGACMHACMHAHMDNFGLVCT